MSKKKIRSTLLVSSLLCFGALTLGSLTSCDTDVINKDENKFESITISNKEALTAEWKLGTATSRRMEITTSPSSNVQSEIMDGNITTTSSDTNVATVNGVNINAVGAGTTTITVTAGTLTDSVTITILPRDEVKTITVAEALDLKSGTNNVTVRAEVIQIASSGYFIADSTGIIYVFETIPSGIAVGDTVVVRDSTTSEYGGLTQLTDPAEVYKEEDTINVTLNFEELTGEALNTIYNDREGAIPVKVTLTMLDEFEDGKFFWIAAGMDDSTVVYTGYIDENTIIKQDFQVNDRYTMTGILGGVGTHNDTKYNFSNRVNFYPISFEKVDSLIVTGIELKTVETTLKQGQPTKLSYEVLPDGAAVANPTYEITEGTNLATINQDSGLLTANKNGAGTVKVVVKAGNVTSNEITITVTEEEFIPQTIESVYSAKDGDKVFIYGEYLGSNYINHFFADGEHSILVYGGDTTMDSLIVGNTYGIYGELDVYNGLWQIRNGTSYTVGSEYKPADPVISTVTTTTAIDNTWSARKATATGTISNHSVDKYGTVKFDIKVNETDTSVIHVVADNRNEEESVLEALKAYKDGDTITITGHILPYTNDRGIEMIQLSLEGTGPEIGADLSTGTFKVGMYQVTNKEWLYLSGTVDSTGNYLASTTNYEEAADVAVTVIDETANTFSMKFADSDTYIGISKNETATKTYYNLKLDLAEPFTWTYNEATHLITGNLDGERYIGTYSGFSTFSVSEISHLNGDDTCIAHLFNEKPESDVEDIPEVPSDALVYIDGTIANGIESSYGAGTVNTTKGNIKFNTAAYAAVGTYEDKTIVLGTNATDTNLKKIENLPVAMLKALDESATEDAYVVNNVYYYAAYMQYDVEQISSVIFETKEYSGSAMDNLYILESLDGGTSWHKTEVTKSSYTYTYTASEKVSKARYAVVVSGSKNKIRVPLLV